MLNINIETITIEQIKNLTIEDIKNYKSIGKKDAYSRETLLIKLCYYNPDIVTKEVLEILKNEIGLQNIHGGTALLCYITTTKTPDIEIIKILSSKELYKKNYFDITPSSCYTLLNKNKINLSILKLLQKADYN